MSHFAFRLLDAALGMVWQSAARLAMPRLCALAARPGGDGRGLRGYRPVAGAARLADLRRRRAGGARYGGGAARPGLGGHGRGAGVVALAAMALWCTGTRAACSSRSARRGAISRWRSPLLVSHWRRWRWSARKPRWRPPWRWSVQCLIVPPVLAGSCCGNCGGRPVVGAAGGAGGGRHGGDGARRAGGAERRRDAPHWRACWRAPRSDGAVYAGVAWSALGWRRRRAPRHGHRRARLGIVARGGCALPAGRGRFDRGGGFRRRLTRASPRSCSLRRGLGLSQLRR